MRRIHVAWSHPHVGEVVDNLLAEVPEAFGVGGGLVRDPAAHVSLLGRAPADVGEPVDRAPRPLDADQVVHLVADPARDHPVPAVGPQESFRRQLVAEILDRPPAAAPEGAVRGHDPPQVARAGVAVERDAAVPGEILDQGLGLGGRGAGSPGRHRAPRWPRHALRGRGRVLGRLGRRLLAEQPGVHRVVHVVVEVAEDLVHGPAVGRVLTGAPAIGHQALADLVDLLKVRPLPGLETEQAGQRVEVGQSPRRGRRQHVVDRHFRAETITHPRAHAVERPWGEAAGDLRHLVIGAAIGALGMGRCIAHSLRRETGRVEGIGRDAGSAHRFERLVSVPPRDRTPERRILRDPARRIGHALARNLRRLDDGVLACELRGEPVPGRADRLGLPPGEVLRSGLRAASAAAAGCPRFQAESRSIAGSLAAGEWDRELAGTGLAQRAGRHALGREGRLQAVGERRGQGIGVEPRGLERRPRLQREPTLRRPHPAEPEPLHDRCERLAGCIHHRWRQLLDYRAERAAGDEPCDAAHQRLAGFMAIQRLTGRPV
ncbi:hypothetical protein MBRA_06309 [Methylobacterium brachiatum]|nr:hypothetical protein MBRA_06309 [Methylobacterium brachiatum]